MLQSNPFELPAVATLGAILIGPTKITVDVIKGAIPKLPGGILPLIGLAVAFVLGIVYEIAVDATFTSALYAQVLLAALGGQGGAMIATSVHEMAQARREGSSMLAEKFTSQDLK